MFHDFTTLVNFIYIMIVYIIYKKIIIEFLNKIINNLILNKTFIFFLKQINYIVFFTLLFMNKQKN